MPLEFPAWKEAKPHSYTATFGLEEGLAANGAATFVVPGFPPPAAAQEGWQGRTPALAAGLAFDQAWLGLVHAKYPPEFCSWLKDRVPVRVGLLSESLTYTRQACLELPTLPGREAYALRQIQSLGLTHVLCSDERDADAIEGSGLARAIWFPTAVPERCISLEHRPPQVAPAVFFGDLYSEERRRLAALPELKDLLAFPRGPEAASGLPAAFDALHAWLAGAMAQAPAPGAEVHLRYVEELRALRKAIFASWMEGLSGWNGLVNLESYFQGYAGRVFEAMAAGVPVVSWAVPDRPRTRALFEDGEDLLLFQPGDVSGLVDHLSRIHADPALARRLREAARQKMLRHHTSEHRVRQVFAWIEEGEPPLY